MKQYNQQRSVTTALSQLELDSMELHLRSEMQRQNKEASTRKQICHDTIKSVITDVEKVEIFFMKLYLDLCQKLMQDQLILK